MPKDATFTPDWVSPPGDTISSILQDRGVSAQFLATELRIAEETLAELLEGRAVLSIELATKCAALLGASPSFWIKRESQYRHDLVRLNRSASTHLAVEWLGELPAKEMRELGWIKPADDPTTIAAECLQFFGVPSVPRWRKSYGETLNAIALRTSKSFASQPGAVAAWLRQGEIRAAAIDCAPWDRQRFQNLLTEIRSLTRVQDPAEFLPTLVQRCATCGVAVVVLRAPKMCKASGASRFLSPSKSMLLLSARHLSDDHFWFTFFHEAGHLILHHDKFLFVDGLGGGDDKMASAEEDETNQFAATVLIPPEHEQELLGLRANKMAVMRFAHKIGISRGIVVGQLQHRGLIGRNQLNGLKIPYRWGTE